MALKEVASLDHHVIDSSKASYGLIPRINAAGRIASPEDALRLLLTDDPDEARQAAFRLDDFNRKRQAMERAILQDLIAEIERRPDTLSRSSFVFASSRWHPGVIGIVAARLVDRYGRPVILISLKDGVGKGSGRSTPDFNIYEGLNRCASTLLTYGGHRFAAGISIRESEVTSFARRFEDIVAEVASGRAFMSETRIDAECELQDINHDLLSQIGLLAPFGSMNPEPVFCIRGVKVQAPSVVGNNHLRMRVSSNGASCNTIWFSKGHLISALADSTLDIAFTPQFNPWNGSSTIQLKMRDVARTTSNRTPR
jgi:single-stranded-DNA-specific exonuclease